MAKKDISKMDMEFASKAADGGLAEVEMGKLAKQKSKSSEVRDLAEELIKDHSQANDTLMKLAKDSDMTVPSTPSGKYKSILDKLKSAEGDEFDRQFVSMQIEEHESEINLFSSEADHGSDPDLREFASGCVPVLKEHLEMARSIYTHMS